jgi:hypothetical protein
MQRRAERSRAEHSRAEHSRAERACVRRVSTGRSDGSGAKDRTRKTESSSSGVRGASFGQRSWAALKKGRRAWTSTREKGPKLGPVLQRQY